MSTSAELLKAAESGAEIRVSYKSGNCGALVEYRPRYKGDRQPWASLEGSMVYRYTAARCQAIPPKPVTAPDVDATAEQTDITPEKETPMGAAHRRHHGPLTPTQKAAVDGMLSGQQQQEVAADLGVAPSYISGELGIARHKLGCTTVAHMIGIVATHKAYLEAASLLEAHVLTLTTEGDETDTHVGHVLSSLAGILRGRAARLVP